MTTEVLMLIQNKEYNTFSTKEMYDEHKQSLKDGNIEDIIKKFIDEQEKHGVNTKEDFLSLVLSEAIQQKDEELVQRILDETDKDKYPALLTNIDSMQMSPLSYALLLDKGGKTQPIIKESLNHGYHFQKIELTKNALLTMYNIIGYQGENYQDYVNDFIRPIIVDGEVKILGEPVTCDLSYFDC